MKEISPVKNQVTRRGTPLKSAKVLTSGFNHNNDKSCTEKRSKPTKSHQKRSSKKKRKKRRSIGEKDEAQKGNPNLKPSGKKKKSDV